MERKMMEKFMDIYAKASRLNVVYEGKKEGSNIDIEKVVDGLLGLYPVVKSALEKAGVSLDIGEGSDGSNAIVIGEREVPLSSVLVLMGLWVYRAIKEGIYTDSKKIHNYLLETVNKLNKHLPSYSYEVADLIGPDNVLLISEGSIFVGEKSTVGFSVVPKDKASSKGIAAAAFVYNDTLYGVYMTSEKKSLTSASYIVENFSDIYASVPSDLLAAVTVGLARIGKEAL